MHATTVFTNEVHNFDARREKGSLVDLSWDTSSEAYSMPEHQHTRTQLLCILSGSVLIETEQGRFFTPPGHALMIPPHFAHAVTVSDKVRMVSMYFDNSDDKTGLRSPAVVEVTPLVRNLLEELRKLLQMKICDEKTSLIELLLLNLVKDLEKKPFWLAFPFSRKLAVLCEKYITSPDPNERLDDWADKLGMSRRAFTRRFRSETGMSFGNWRQMAVVFRSLPKLANGESVTSIALECGYENVSAYITMFRRVIGCSPKAYIQNPHM